MTQPKLSKTVAADKVALNIICEGLFLIGLKIAIENRYHDG